MDMLNSIILEGNVVKAGILERSYKNKAGEMVKEKPVFSVYTVGNMAEYASDKRRMREGRGVRVVGRLTVDDGKTKIFAEHIEYKPEHKEG